MGWSGYGLYDGDGTQTLHLDFIKWAIPSLSEDEIFDMLKYRKTSIPKNLHVAFRKRIPYILEKIKVPKNSFAWDEDSAIEWQMLLSLFVDNNMGVPTKILVYGTLASHYLLGIHANEFDSPSRRKACLKRFIKKVDESFCTVKARQEINRRLNM